MKKKPLYLLDFKSGILQNVVEEFLNKLNVTKKAVANDTLVISNPIIFSKKSSLNIDDKT